MLNLFCLGKTAKPRYSNIVQWRTRSLKAKITCRRNESNEVTGSCLSGKNSYVVLSYLQPNRTRVSKRSWSEKRWVHVFLKGILKVINNPL